MVYTNFVELIDFVSFDNIRSFKNRFLGMSQNNRCSKKVLRERLR